MNNGQATVLIVDDTVENLRVLGDILELDGHEVRVATTGLEALDTVRQSRPDLILLDVMMPGIDGYEVFRRLRADVETAAIPVIFLTAFEEEPEDLSTSDQNLDFVSKPFRLSVVRRRIAQQLELSRLRHELSRLQGKEFYG